MQRVQVDIADCRHGRRPAQVLFQEAGLAEVHPVAYLSYKVAIASGNLHLSTYNEVHFKRLPPFFHYWLKYVGQRVICRVRRLKEDILSKRVLIEVIGVTSSGVKTAKSITSPKSATKSSLTSSNRDTE